RAPPGIGDDRYGAVADLDHLLHAPHALDLRGVEALHLAAEDGAILDRGVEEARQLDVDAVDRLADHLVGGIEPLERLADQLPLLRVLQLHVLRHRQLRRGFGDLAVPDAALRGTVRDDAVRGAALGDRDLPLVGRGLRQHHARGGAAFAHVFVRFADAAAAAGREIAPRALALHALAGRRVLDLHLGPVAFELVGNELRESGDRALPHLGAHYADVDGVV